MARTKRDVQDSYNEPFPTRLRELINKNGISQNQLSTIINKTRQAVSNYTLGNTSPDADTLIKLSKYFNVSADYLLGLSDSQSYDKDIQFICDYTGLNEDAVYELNELKTLQNETVAEADAELPFYDSAKSSEYNLKLLNRFLTTPANQVTYNIFEYILDLNNYLNKLKQIDEFQLPDSATSQDDKSSLISKAKDFEQLINSSNRTVRFDKMAISDSFFEMIDCFLYNDTDNLLDDIADYENKAILKIKQIKTLTTKGGE